MGKIKSILIMTMLFTVLIPLTPHVTADAPNIMGFDESIKHVTIGESFTTNIYVDVSSEIDSASVDNLTFIPAGIINYSSTTQGNLFSDQVVWMTPEGNGEINNISGYAKPITWSHSETVNGTNKTLATITWYAYRVGMATTKITAGGTAFEGVDPGTEKNNGTVYVHPSAPSTLEISSSSQDHPSYNELSWTIPPNIGIDTVSVNYNTAHVPTSATDGTEIYNDTGTSYNHTNVPIESDIYYAAWGWNETEGMYSYTSINTSSESSNLLPSTFEAEAVANQNDKMNLSWTSSLPSQSLTLRPNDNGSITEGTPSVGYNWQCVNEESANGWGDHVTLSNGNSDTYSIENISYSVNDITVYAEMAEANPPGGSATIDIYNGVSKQSSASKSLTTSFATYSEKWSSNPWTSSAWTSSDINSLEIGITSEDLFVYLTQIYVEVNYTPAQTIYIENNTLSSWNRGEGNIVYNGTETSCQDNGLTSHTRYYYQAWVYDSTDGMFSSTYQSANAITSGPNSPPTISNESIPTSANTSETITINVSVSDVDGVGSVWLNTRYNSSTYPNAQNYSMTNTGGNYFEKSIILLINTTDDFFFNISANDTNNAWATTSDYNCTITDNEIPVVTDNTPSTTIVAGGIAFFLVTCTDNVGVSSVNITYTQGSTTDELSLSLKNGTNQSGNWNGSLNVPLDNADDISYTVNATDSSGNSNTTVTGLITVNDNTSPTIGSVTIIPSSGTMGTNINISCTITDNIAVDTVTFNITSPDATSTNATISTKTGDTYYDNATYDQRGTYTIMVYANDTSNNLNNSTAQTFTITNRAPTITHPNPTNGTLTANPHGFTWNATIADADTGDLLNWSITCSNSESSSGSNEADGSKTLTLTDNNLNYDTNYTIWVNATDGRNSTNNTFWFETRTQYDPELPSIFMATAYNRTIINISWTPGNNATHTYIEYNAISSWAKGSGSGQWNCTNTTYNHTGLEPDTKYYYQAWSYNTTDNVWSTENTRANATTDNQIPTFTSPLPTNGSENQNLTVNWSVNISDGDGDTFDWWINCSAGSNSGSGDSDGRYNVTLSDLDYDTEYTITVEVVDRFGGWNSSSYTFTTRDYFVPDPPSGFEATAHNRTTIVVNWTRVGVNYTIVEFMNESDYSNPWTRGVGTELYNGTAERVVDSNHTAGQTVYYQAWSWNSTDGNYSETNVSVSASSSDNILPVFSSEEPSNTTTDVNITQSLVNVTVSDAEGDLMRWNISVYDDSYALVDSDFGSNQVNGSISCSLSTPLSHHMVYTWNVSVLDGYNWSNVSYTFTTRDYFVPDPPTGLEATGYNRTTVVVNWTRAGVNYTIVEFMNESDYSNPWTRGVGTELYNGTAERVVDSNHTAGQTVYYQAWSWNSTDGNYSTSNVSTHVTTDANNHPSLSGEQPSDATTEVDITQSSVNVSISDVEGDLMTWNISVYNGTSALVASDEGSDAGNGSISCSLSTPLSHNMEYTWQVNVTDSFNWTNTSYTFTTRAVYTPELPSGFDASAYNRTVINITWTAGDNASQTYIENNTVANWERGSGNMVYNSTGSAFNHTGLLPNATYYYQAWSYNATDNNWSVHNVSHHATTENQVPAISSPTPTNDSENQNLTVNWSVSISDGDGDTFDWWINCSAGSSSGTNDSDGRYNVTLSGLGYNTSYRMNVTAVDSYDGRNSTWFNFTTRDYYVPSPPSGFTATVVNRTTINLTWSNAGSNHTIIEYQNMSDYSSAWQRGSGTEIYNGTGTSTNDSNHSAGQTVYYQAWSWNSTDGNYSTSNVSTHVTTDANNHPSLSGEQPSDATTEVDITQSSVNVTISDAESDLMSWNISVYNATSALIASNESSNAGNGSISCSLSTPLSHNMEYTWQVNVTDSFNWTNASYSFTTRDEYTAELPSTFTATAHNRTVINISWTPGANASHTYIEYLTQSEYTSSWIRGSGHGQWNCTNTSYNHTGLEPGTKYYYQAWSYNTTDTVWSTGNTGANATTTNQVPTFTSPIPTNGSENQNLTVNWSIQIDDADGDTFDWWINCSAGSNRSTDDSDGRYNVTLSGLGFNTSYRVNVTAVDSYGGSNSSWYNFTTRDYYVPSPPSDLTATAVNRTTINLTWSNAGSNHTIIEYQNMSDYTSAWTRGSGTKIYNGTGTTTLDSNHTSSQMVYYQAWSWNSTDGNYSTSNVSAHATTDANNHPDLTGEQPSNTTTNVDITQSSVNVTISDAESDLMSWNISVYNATSVLVDSNESSNAGNGTISCSLSPPLDYNETFTWNVNVSDGYNWTNATYNFTTRDYYVPSPPTGFTATAFNKTTIILSWANNGTNYTIIEYKNSSDYTTGWDLGTGTEIYNGTGTSTNDSNHTASQKVYYQAWSWNATDGNYSTSYNSTDNTTLANVAPVLQNEHPTNGSEDIDITQSYVNVTIVDNDETMDWNITIYNETGHQIGTNNGTNAATNSNISATISETLDWNETITWYVNVSDGYNWTNATYNFTTRDKYYPPAPTNFNGTAYNKTAINLTWAWPTQYADRVCIDYTQGDTPPTGASGFDYNNTGTSWNATNLTADTNYSFTIWGYNATENVYTRSPANVTVSTLENYAPQTRNETPTNQTTGVNKTQATVNITITDANSEDTIDWNISVYNDSFDLVASNESTDAANGTLISCTLTTPLILSHNYTWNVSLSDGCSGYENTTYWFVVRAAYQPATPSLTATTYNTTQINLSIGTGANTSHVRVEYNTSSSTWNRGNGALVQNNTNDTANVTGLDPHTKYYFQAWAYNVTDNTWGSVNRSNATTDNTLVNFTDPNPTNQSTTANPHGFNWSVNITDADVDTFNWTIVCSNGENTSGINENNGRKNLTLTDANLSYNTQYTIWVNATDKYNNTNESFVFTTRAQYIPDPPTSFTATTYNHTAINLSWINNDVNKTYIERNNTTSSWTRGSGTMIQNLTTNTTYNDTGLTNGTHYYYRAWSYNETDECYSATSTVTSAITTFENNILIHSPQPADLATNILTNQSNVSIMINSTIGEQFNYTISGNKIVTTQGINQTNDTFTANISSTLDYGTQYSWTIRVNTANGWANATYVFTTNYKPILTVSASPSSGNTPLTTMITYTISDSDGSITNANLSFGDGNYLNVTQNATGSINYTYSNSGTYTVTLTATDDQNASNTTTTQIEVTTAGGGPGGGTAIPPATNPTADAGGPYTGIVNETITFDGSGSSDPDGSIVSYEWDFGDGTTATGVNPTHSYATADSYTVTLTVTADDEQTATDTATVTITENIVEVTEEIKQELEELYNISLPDDFSATDTNGDGVVDHFTDPNGILYEIRYTTLEDDGAFLVSVNGDLLQLFLWIPGLNEILSPVIYQMGTVVGEEENTTANTMTVTIEVEKANWTYFEVEDIYPTRLVIVQTADGRVISEDRIWRENGSIFVLDDPAVLYDLIYAAEDVSIGLNLMLSEENVEYGTPIQAMIDIEHDDSVDFAPGTLTCSLSRNNETFWSETIIISDENEVSLNRTIITKGLPFDTYTYTASYTTGTDQTIEATASFTVTEPTMAPPWILIILFNLLIIGMAIFYYLYKQGIIVIER